MEAVCNDRNMAISILDTISQNMKNGTQKMALCAARDWIMSNVSEDITRLTHEERKARILEIETHLRDCMSNKERKAKAAFYYGIPPGQDFNIVILPPGSDCMAKESGIVDFEKTIETLPEVEGLTETAQEDTLPEVQDTPEAEKETQWKRAGIGAKTR